MSAVEKKVTVRKRHRDVAALFAHWLEHHPKATMEEKIQKLDELEDEAWEQDVMIR